MLFNSYVFILCYLPVVLGMFYALGRLGNRELTIGWLVLASLFFYGWWNPVYLSLILASICINYALARQMLRAGAQTPGARRIATVGIVANLSALAYFKYTVFFVTNLNGSLGTDLFVPHIILPLAISFFTFQQISFLADTYAGKSRAYNFLHYCLFVTFFPQLIAGPIVHHGEMMPQFEKRGLGRYIPANLAIGASIFIIGLFKKVVLADGIAVYATPVFQAADAGVDMTLIEAWGGVLAYTFQIYFDFSGYSDMAIGIARMFGIVLPLNFDSPYKSLNIIDFWRRWHMTLSRFLRDYVYIPLGGNRKGPSRRYTNLLMTMLIGGLWHGAGWNFVIWGALHGGYLMVNHGWNGVKVAYFSGVAPSRAGDFAARALTLLAVCVAWVFFRAETLDGALRILRGMFGFNGVSLPAMHQAALNRFAGLGDQLASVGVAFAETPHFIGALPVAHLLALLLICWYLPNSQQLFAEHKPVLEPLVAPGGGRGWQRHLSWAPTAASAAGLGLLMIYTLSSMTGISEFLYFQF